MSHQMLSSGIHNARNLITNVIFQIHGRKSLINISGFQLISFLPSLPLYPRVVYPKPFVRRGLDPIVGSFLSPYFSDFVCACQGGVSLLLDSAIGRLRFIACTMHP